MTHAHTHTHTQNDYREKFKHSPKRKKSASQVKEFLFIRQMVEQKEE